MARTDVIYGNVAAIPLEDRVIDVALLRSVYGQFTGKKYHYFDDAVLYGPMELYRVLKPGGHVAVVEENTPWDPRYVESYFQNAGFEIADFQPKPEGEWDDINPDHPWRKLRERYYGDDQANRYHRGYHGTPYILVAKKPENAVDVTEKLDYSGWDERQAERFDEVRLYTRGERRAAPSLVH